MANLSSSARIDVRRIQRQRGVTLTELMIALVLGALVVLAATAMVVSSRSTYRTQDETTRLAESARFGLELSNRLIRLAGYTNFGNPNSGNAATPPIGYVPDSTWASTASGAAYALNGPTVVGADNSKPIAGAVVNNSDSLVIRYFGSNDLTGAPDGNILDCAGASVPEPKVDLTTDANTANRLARAYNVLYVDLDPTDNEPSLYCARQTYDATNTPQGVQPGRILIRGVESFQVLYGEYIPQGFPNNDLDVFPPASVVWRTGIAASGTSQVAVWANVRAVRISMLLRSATGARAVPEAGGTVYSMFGAGYPGAGDPGATFTLPSGGSELTRVRRIVQTTVFIRNRVADWPSLFVN